MENHGSFRQKPAGILGDREWRKYDHGEVRNMGSLIFILEEKFKLYDLIIRSQLRTSSALFSNFWDIQGRTVWITEPSPSYQSLGQRPHAVWSSCSRKQQPRMKNCFRFLEGENTFLFLHPTPVINLLFVHLFNLYLMNICYHDPPLLQTLVAELCRRPSLGANILTSDASY